MGSRFDDLESWDTLNIYVTKSDIKNGKMLNGSSCPIARCLTRRGFKGVSISTMAAVFNTPLGQYVRLRLSDKARDFIRRFDNGGRVKPFRATLKKHINSW